MIIWTGQGYLVAVIVFGFSLVMNLIVDGIFGRGTYTTHPSWGLVLALGAAASMIWLLGTALQKSSDRVVIDKQTGKEFVLNNSKHAFFFVPMKYWAIPIGIWATCEILGVT